MAAERDYVMLNKNNLITKSDMATQNRTDQIVAKVHVIAKVCIRLIYIYI